MKNIKLSLFGRVVLGVVIGLALLAGPMASRANQRLDFSRVNPAEYVHDEVVVKFKDADRFSRVAVGQGESVVQVVERFNRRPDVEYAEPNFKAFTLSALDVLYDEVNRDPAQYPDYTDQKYAEQWALNNEGKTGGTVGADVDWPEARDYLVSNAVGLDQTVVAVVDTGMDVTHPDLNDKVYASYSVLDGTGDVTDGFGHGTHVAGTVASETNNYEADRYEGVASVGFDGAIKLFPIKVLDDSGSGTNADVAEGIYYAADHGANVINLSLGSYWDSQVVKDSVNYAWNKGLVIAAAAGNSGNKRKVYPAYYEKVISVAATDHADRVASFSTHNNGVDVSAPGVDVLSTFPYTGSFGIQDLYGRMNKYDVGSGTSMASPHVAGLAALLLAQHSDWSNSDVRAVIESTVDDLGKTGWDEYYGHGRINVLSAVMSDGAVVPTPTPTPADDGGSDSCPPGWQKQGRC